MMVPSKEEINKYVAEGLIGRVDLGELSIYNYTRAQTYKGVWDNVTMACRGLVLNRTSGEVVAFPWPKFFNHAEWGQDVKIPTRKPTRVTIKMDGCLGILYRYEGKIRWTTRGSFYSEQSTLAQQLWDNNYSHIHVPEEWTLLAEIIHDDAQIIVRYDFNDLVVLGARDRFNLRDVPFDEVAAWATENGLRMVQTVDADLQSCIATAQTLDENNEGFVLDWDGYRVKVKGERYCQIARILQGLTDRGIADLWYYGIEDEALLSIIPEEFRGEMETTFSEYDREAKEVESEVITAYTDVIENTSNRRDAAARTNKFHKKYFKMIMLLCSEKEPDYRLEVYKKHFPGKAPRRKHDIDQRGDS